MAGFDFSDVAEGEKRKPGPASIAAIASAILSILTLLLALVFLGIAVLVLSKEATVRPAMRSWIPALWLGLYVALGTISFVFALTAWSMSSSRSSAGGAAKVIGIVMLVFLAIQGLFCGMPVTLGVISVCGSVESK